MLLFEMPTVIQNCTYEYLYDIFIDVNLNR